MYPIGKKNQVKYIHTIVIYRAITKYNISIDIINNINFINNLTPSVIGVITPNKNNAGPILN